MKEMSCRHHRIVVSRDIDVMIHTIGNKYMTVHVENVTIKECIYCQVGILNEESNRQIDEFILKNKI